MPEPALRLERARVALEGLALGDGFGERFFVAPVGLEGLPPTWLARREPIDLSCA